MTILGAVDLDGRILVAGDSIVLMTDANGAGTHGESTDKVWYASGMPSVAWGFTGDGAVGLGFKQWLDVQSFPTWEDLLAQAEPVLARLNGDARRVAQVAGARRQGVDVLLGGHIAGEGRIAIVHEDGGVTRPLSNPFFLGGAAPHCVVAWEALTRVISAEQLNVEDSFRHVLEAAADRLVVLGPPVAILETTSRK